ncbi:anti-sigma factor domain-containing protein [Tepidanaerobacter acetatoxydans]|uniref:anti-sigma-I factor RsgI family protein n=1 Tax=Tepidanaerobacter acetatoxydans TaxID=499229 RepID=UPI001BD5F923|nr:anti-sigma factor domain-containing protein [Tepidanaerobacter acetatoxydans]
MKGIIVDFDGKYIIVANSKGDFKRIYNNYTGCQIGDEITIKESRTAFLEPMLSSVFAKRALAAAACFLIMIIGSYGIYDYVSPVTYVTVDINPSVEFSINRYDLVIKAYGLNDEGNSIVGDGREYKNMKLDAALNLLLVRAAEFNYLNEDTNTIMLTASNVKDSISPNIQKQLEEISKNGFQAETANTSGGEIKTKDVALESHDAVKTANSDLDIIVESTTFEKHQAAKKLNISQGKLVLYDKLKEVKPDISLKRVKETPVTQIIKELEKASNEQIKKIDQKGNDNIYNEQQWKEIKTLKKDIKNQYKDIRNNSKFLPKEENRKNQEQPIKAIKDKIKQTEKDSKTRIKLNNRSNKGQKKFNKKHNGN